ncbi:MAG: hypothetical protein AAGG46_09455, partial [Planctomycetota bacterium]
MVAFEASPACWNESCGDTASCGEPCCSDGCCSDTCCGCVASGCCLPCSQNCGLLGHGLLTYDACADGSVLPELLLGRFCTTEPCFDDFISPMTNPVFFEDPRNVTELRGIFLQHRVPLTAGGGDIQLYALQIRARLTERLSLVAAKDGYIVSENPVVGDGWADVDIGFKYALIRNARDQRLLSAGVIYDAPFGTPRAQQARGDGEFHLFMTGGTQLGDCGHWLSAFGGLLPVDGDASSSFLYWSNHFDYQVRRGWYAVTEFNWFNYQSGGSNALGLTGVDGGDLFNFGSGGVDGNDIVTGAVGVKYKPNR